MKLKGVKDRLKDENLDLSLCDLQEVPVREIAAVRKASTLDLSSNCLTVLPTTFVTLRHIIKLDLSRNMLTEIPENFGEMSQLRHLDLYTNRISRLPLSLGELKNLRWLDLKENPLTPAVASVAGPCSNLVECQKCARSIVAFLSNAKLAIEEEKLKRLNATADTDVDNAFTRKEGKKKKKKVDKESKKDLDKNKNKPSGKTKDNQNLNNGSYEKMMHSASNDGIKRKKQVTNGKLKAGFCQTFTSVIAWCFFIFLVFMVAILVMPLYFEKESVLLMDYIETHTGVSLKAFHKYSTDTLRFSTEVVTAWTKNFYHTIRAVYEKNLGGKES